ncbi:hypothetical protein B0H14DRAFT_3676972 [Mycena olivaceomarginata]|nr:hypothetical protein B0H14DRAFT_3676972 [Mycena olivaceomarginata]
MARQGFFFFLVAFALLFMNAYSFWSDSFTFFLYVASASIVVLLSHLLWESGPGLKLRARYFKALSTQPEYTSETTSIAGHAEAHGGTTIFAYKVARLLGCLVLLSLSLVSVALDNDEKETGTFTHQWILLAKSRASHISLCITYFYASVLAVVSVGSVNWRNVAVKHLNALLLCTFGVYFYRDIFLLATFSLLPQDLEEGRLLWTKIFVLFAISIILPVAIPRQYTPVEPKHSSPVPNPEQTASLSKFSLVFYFFLDPIIFLGYSVPHLKFDQLPPLSDYDYAENLKQRAWPHMDPFSGKAWHIFFGFLWTYRSTVFNMAITLSIPALSAFISPTGINRLLSHLENPNQEWVTSRNHF